MNLWHTHYHVRSCDYSYSHITYYSDLNTLLYKRYYYFGNNWAQGLFWYLVMENENWKIIEIILIDRNSMVYDERFSCRAQPMCMVVLSTNYSVFINVFLEKLFKTASDLSGKKRKSLVYYNNQYTASHGCLSSVEYGAYPSWLWAKRCRLITSQSTTGQTHRDR